LDFAVLDHFQHPSILLLFLDSNIGPTYWRYEGAGVWRE
jgi:hypothetical protein